MAERRFKVGTPEPQPTTWLRLERGDAENCVHLYAADAKGNEQILLMIRDGCLVPARLDRHQAQELGVRVSDNGTIRVEGE